jgi:hypothetical protein
VIHEILHHAVAKREMCIRGNRLRRFHFLCCKANVGLATDTPQRRHSEIALQRS